MNDLIEALVWRGAFRHSTPDLRQKLTQALDLFKRSPGLNDLTRLHVSTTGHEGLSVLSEALARRAKHVWHVCHDD